MILWLGRINVVMSSVVGIILSKCKAVISQHMVKVLLEVSCISKSRGVSKKSCKHGMDQTISATIHDRQGMVLCTCNIETLPSLTRAKSSSLPRPHDHEWEVVIDYIARVSNDVRG